MTVRAFRHSLTSIMAKFPFEFYEIMDNLTLMDPYVSKFHHTTIALGNTSHQLEISAPSESRANEAIAIANDLAARCFPFSGGMDGLVDALFSQIARSGGMCVEWVPNYHMSKIERAFLVPIKTIRFRYGSRGTLELCQLQTSGTVALNPTQVAFYAAQVRDDNPYPIPPAIAALESCATHRAIITKIRTWMDKVSALGVLLAEVEPPPREPGETQAQYDSKALAHLNSLAETITDNMEEGLGVAYNTVKFTFNNTQASAQGAKDILQIVLQGLFAALHRDPVFMGWNWSSTETFAKVVYEEMVQSIKSYQLGVKRVLEHGHRLNLALHGYGDIGVSVAFVDTSSIDDFRVAEAEYMRAQSVIALLEAELVDKEEARKRLGLDDKKASAGEYIASFNRDARRYELVDRHRMLWPGEAFSLNGDHCPLDENQAIGVE